MSFPYLALKEATWADSVAYQLADGDLRRPVRPEIVRSL